MCTAGAQLLAAALQVACERQGRPGAGAGARGMEAMEGEGNRRLAAPSFPVPMADIASQT